MYLEKHIQRAHQVNVSKVHYMTKYSFSTLRLQEYYCKVYLLSTERCYWCAVQTGPSEGMGKKHTAESEDIFRNMLVKLVCLVCSKCWVFTQSCYHRISEKL